MGDLHDFKRPRRRPHRSPPQQRHRRSIGKRWTRRIEWLIAPCLFIALVAAYGQTRGAAATDDSQLTCTTARVIDGDTFDCDGRRIRLAGIDAPELPGHCRRGRECTPGDPFASSAHLSSLMAARTVQCRPTGTDVYGRTIARCTAGNEDVSCAQLASGDAVRRYGWIWCGLPR